MWGALLGGLAGGLFQGMGARSAARSQERMAREEMALRREMFDLQRGDFEPYREAGANALDAYMREAMKGPEDGFVYEASPGYHVQRDAALGAIQGSAAAQGGLFSGATMRELGRTATGLAQGDFWNSRQFAANRRDAYMGHLGGLANMGHSAAAQQATAAGNYADGASNALGAIGNAQAAGAVGFGNAVNDGIGNALSVWAFQNSPAYGGGAAPPAAGAPAPWPSVW